jgi:gliding motility-associated lipoprotein GldH
MNRIKRLHLCLVCCALYFFSCQTIDLYEKTATIPGHKWSSSFKPTFKFTIKDNAVPYQLYITLRHRDRYNYNNIYIKLTTQQPGQDSTRSARYDLKLGSDETGWLGSGMDDIYEHRIPLTPAGTPFYFRKPGEYTFTIEQVMREDPLENVLNVGLRIEKK